MRNLQDSPQNSQSVASQNDIANSPIDLNDVIFLGVVSPEPVHVIDLTDSPENSQSVASQNDTAISSPMALNDGISLGAASAEPENVIDLTDL